MYSIEELANDFRKLGIAAGDTVMLHASVRAVGEVAGGSNVLVQPELEKRRSPLVSIPPFVRGFSRHGVFRSDGGWGGVRTSSHAPVHRFDGPTGIALGMVASPQCPLPFRRAKSL